MAFKLRDYFLFSPSESQLERAQLFWLVRMRWLTVAFLFLLTPVGWQAGMIHRLNMGLYIGVLGILGCLNLMTHSLWLEKTKKVSRLMIAYQLALDLMVLTALLILTGGLSNPFWTLLYVNVALGASLLDGRRSLVFLILCHFALLAVQVLTGAIGGQSGGEVIFLKHSLGLFWAQHMVLLISWAACRSLGHYISLQHKNLLQVQVFAEKMDRLRALGALTAGFSHEFASPLNAVKLRVERELRERPESKNLIEMSQAVEDCTAVIRQMNSAQLDPREYRFQQFDLTRATRDVVGSWSKDHEQARVEFLATAPLFVEMPVINFAQALLNLLDNAYEAHAEGLILISLSQEISGPHSNRKKVVLSVQNAGSAFPEDVLQRLGEPFVTTKATGTGLGLYSVQLFAQSLGGSLELKNLSAGALVQIHFPSQVIKETRDV